MIGRTTPTAADSAVSVIGQGHRRRLHEIVVERAIPPGRYVAANAVSGCYWERLSGLGGTLAEILANDFQGFAGRVIVDVKATDTAFKFKAACGTFKSYTAPSTPATSIVPGAHVVGAHIASGTYAANAGSGCYWERLRSFDGESSSIIANDFMGSAGPVYVAISPGDAGFHATDKCGVWTPA